MPISHGRRKFSADEVATALASDNDLLRRFALEYEQRRMTAVVKNARADRVEARRACSKARTERKKAELLALQSELERLRKLVPQEPGE